MWGLNTHGQLGLGDTVTRTTPQLVTHSDPNFLGFDHVAISGNTVYAIDFDSGKICVWGEGFTSSPVLLPDNDERWSWITADDEAIMATDIEELYAWSDVYSMPFSSRILAPWPEHFDGPQVSGGGGILYSSSPDSLRFVADSAYPPLTIDSNVEFNEYTFTKSGEMLAYIKNGRLYFIEDVPDMVQDHYNGLDTSVYPTQVGIDTDWLFVYSSENGLIAGKADDENGTLHVYGEIGDDIYTEWTEISLDFSPGSEDLSRIVTIWYQGRYLYLPDGARMFTPRDPDK